MNAPKTLRDGAQDAAQRAPSGDLPMFAWTYPLLGIAVLVHAYLCWRWRTNLVWDAGVTYLPFARRLLNEGWAFLLTEESVWSPIGAYGYPALLDADVPAIEAVNMLLSAAIVLMVYRVATRAHSVLAGLIGAWLYAVSPSVAPLVINVLTELPFLFFCAVWLWAFSELCASGQRRWIWIAGLALGCAVNMRASLVPFIYGSAILAAVASTRRVPGRHTWRKFAGVQGIAAAIMTLVILKNWLLFGLPQIATGGGNAFYLGNHTLTGGYEPMYGGLFFDVNGVVQGEQRTLRADRILQSVGWEMLRVQPLPLTLANYWRKAWAFLFYPNVLLNDSMFTLRSLRICLVAGAGVALIRGWRVPALLLAASIAAYQVVVHTPLLYDARYSEGSLDLWLPVLAGCGFATVARWPWRNGLLFALALLAACYAGKTIRHLEDRVAPLHFNASVPHRVIWEQNGVADASLADMVPDSAGNALLATAEHPSVRVNMPDVPGITGNGANPQRDLFLILELWTPPDGKRCDKGRISFQPDAASPQKPAPSYYYPFRLERDTKVQTFSFGVSAPTPTWPRGINGAGTFKIALACDPGGALRLVRLAVAESTYGEVYGRSLQVPGSR
jgi:Dolichyl-phosphate-mannose-protein mannosyltransferase